MVLAEKGNNNDGGPRNGRRSRGPSPNGMHAHHQQADSTSEDESSVPVDKIRVGRDYQAVCPELQLEALRKPELLADRALLVWSPTADIAESKLEDYIVLAKDKYGYNGEQALGMLFWHKHDLERAVLDLANFTPFPDEWSVEDKVLFEQAFQFHGKSFHRIRQMLPDKSIASLVKYYYGWKKTRSRTSLMDKQARKLQVQTAGKSGTGSASGDENATNAAQHAVTSGGVGANASEPNSANDDSDHEETNKNTSYGGKVPIQPNKTTLTLKRKHTDSLDDIRQNDRTACRWTHDELSLAVESVRKYGKDWKAIAEALGNKSEQHVKTFYLSYRKKYGLDMILRDWERANLPNPQANSSAGTPSNSGNVVSIAITASNNKNNNNNNSSRPGLLLSSAAGNIQQQQDKQQQSLTTIDIADDDDIDDDDDNTSDVICISPSPPPSQPLSTAPSISITATSTNSQPKPPQQQSNGKMALATVSATVAPAQTNNSTAIAVVAHALK